MEEGGIDVSEALDNWNTTIVSLTMNANFALNTQEELEEFDEEMQQLLLRDLAQPINRQKVFGNVKLVKKVKFANFESDIGDKYRKAHVHLTVTIKHRVQKYSVVKLAERLKNWLDENYTRSHGWYVHAKLVKAKELNYNNKHSRHAMNQQVASNPSFTQELDRLEDPRILVDRVRNGRNIKKLAHVLEALNIDDE